MSPKGIRYSEVNSGHSSKLYGRISLTTKGSPLFKYYHTLFYVKLSDLSLSNCTSQTDVANLKNKYIKVIPSNIEELLTPVAIAFLIYGDGNDHKTKQIIRLCTNNLTKTEVDLLSKALLNKFNIKSRLERVRNNQFLLIIRNTQVPVLQNLVKDHIHLSMLYRIGLNSINS